MRGHLYWPKNTSALLPLTRFPGSAVPGVAASIRADTLRSPVPTASSPDAVGTDRPPASRVPPRPPLRSPSHPLVVPSLRCFLPHGRYTPAASTRTASQHLIVIGKNVEVFNPWAGCVRSRTGGIRPVPTQFLGKPLGRLGRRWR